VRNIYICCVALLTPLLHGVFLYKGLRSPGWWRNLGERYGRGPRARAGGLWVHASSVGEVQAGALLVGELLARHPDLAVTFTTFTPSGRERARSLFGDRVLHRYVPIDLPWAVRGFLDAVQPRLAVILEIELWPTLFHECGLRGIPLLLASARLSERSAASYRRLAWLFRPLLAGQVTVAAQTAADAERLRALGADPVRTHVTGNLKFDHPLAPETVARARQLRSELGAGRPVWVAGSTHEGEEEVVLDAHARVCARHPDALLVLVPRKPPRAAEVATLLRRRALSYVARSSGVAVGPDAAVLLVDTLGELVAFYGAGDLAFVGGSLGSGGGHNLLEPAAFAKPVLTGPNNASAPSVARLLAGCGAAHVVRDAAELAERVTAYLSDPALRERDGRAGLDTLEANRGALARVVALVEPLLISP
jgi:3-deoxy-D-manno-octulosonic-acid transferase